ncbi:MAG: hypothetical protein ACRDJX_05750, partial [Solirubrobacteraceae bacterium]
TVLSATNANGARTQAVTAGALQEVGWGGAKLSARVLARRSVTRLHSGERVATVALSGAGSARTVAVARSALGGPSLGWQLLHLL